MSWLISYKGRAAAVAKQAADRLGEIKCSEPEETLKNLAAQQIATSLGAMDSNYPVEIEASGSQSTDSDKAVNQLSVKITPIWCFIEN